MKYKNIVAARSYIEKKLKDRTIRIFFDEEKTKSDIARLIRDVRGRVGMNQREFAKRAGTTQAVVARLEAGADQRMPSIFLIARLLRAANAHLELKCMFDKAA